MQHTQDENSIRLNLIENEKTLLYDGTSRTSTQVLHNLSRFWMPSKHLEAFITSID